MKSKDIPIFGGFLNWMEEQDIGYGILLLIVGALILLAFFYYTGFSQTLVFSMLFATAPIWLPYLSFHIFFENYMNMVKTQNKIKSGRAIYEIVLPAEVFKSPEAMEFVFTQIYNKATPDNFMQTYLEGKHPLPYTIEMVSKGGDVRFYATLPLKNVDGLRDALFSQYPGVELRRQEIDYTAEIPSSLEGWTMLSFHMGKKKDQEIPIKTYIDFGLDKMPKEEEKIDPMTPMLEMLGGIKPHQQLWIQFIFIAHRENSLLNGQLSSSPSWEKGVEKKIQELLEKSKIKGRGEDDDGNVILTPGKRNLIEAMERNMGKTPYEFACRVIYLSKQANDYDGGLVSRMLRSFAATEVTGRNGIGARWRTDFNYKMFSDPFNKVLPALKRTELLEYKLRVLAPKSGAMQYRVMTAEELATLFHIPGTVAATPTLNRVQSTRAVAPPNLPTG